MFGETPELQPRVVPVETSTPPENTQGGTLLSEKVEGSEGGLVLPSQELIAEELTEALEESSAPETTPEAQQAVTAPEAPAEEEVAVESPVEIAPEDVPPPPPVTAEAAPEVRQETALAPEAAEEHPELPTPPPVTEQATLEASQPAVKAEPEVQPVQFTPTVTPSTEHPSHLADAASAGPVSVGITGFSESTDSQSSAQPYREPAIGLGAPSLHDPEAVAAVHANSEPALETNSSQQAEAVGRASSEVPASPDNHEKTSLEQVAELMLDNPADKQVVAGLAQVAEGHQMNILDLQPVLAKRLGEEVAASLVAAAADKETVHFLEDLKKLDLSQEELALMVQQRFGKAA